MRSRTIAQASAMVIGDPNTARPTTTVSIPVSTTVLTAVRIAAPTIPVSHPAASAPEMSEAARPDPDGAVDDISPYSTIPVMIWVITTTTAVSPSTVFGLDRT